MDHGPSSSRVSGWPLLIPLGVAGYLVLAYLAIWVVDVQGAFGGSGRLQEAGLEPPLLWVQLFTQGGLTELIQWALLGAIVVLAAMLAGMHLAEGAGEPAQHPAQRQGRFWALVSVVAALMLIEDAGNPRHLLRHYAHLVDETLARPVEGLYLAAVGAIGVYAFLRYGRELARVPSLRLLGGAGVALYALAVGMNVLRSVGDLYLWLGSWLIDEVLGAPWLADDFAVPYLAPLGLDLRFFFVDFVVEESLEALGAAFLLAAVVMYARSRLAARGEREAMEPRPRE